MNDDKVEHGAQREREGARYVDHWGLDTGLENISQRSGDTGVDERKEILFVNVAHGISASCTRKQQGE